MERLSLISTAPKILDQNSNRSCRSERNQSKSRVTSPVEDSREKGSIINDLGSKQGTSTELVEDLKEEINL